MHIHLELPRARLRRWHIWLIEHIKETAANYVSVTFTDGEHAPATPLNLLLTLDALTRARGAQSGSQSVTPNDILTVANAPSDGDACLVVRLGEGGTVSTDAPTLNLLYDDCTHEDAMWLALLERRAPRLELHQRAQDDETGHTTHAVALPALEARHALSHSADAVFSRAIEMIGGYAGKRANGSRPEAMPVPDLRGAPKPAPSFQPGKFLHRSSAFLARRVGDKARSVLTRVTKTAPHWSVAWRPRAKFSPTIASKLDVSDFKGLPDDGARYFADPFALDKDGLTHVFVEEFPYATARGLISALTIDADGSCSTPRPVLETDVHLSYPQVFEHEGDIFMLPEASQSGGLDLYRADPFPDTWVHEARLIDEPLHDATVYFDGTRWWLFAATQFLKSASWCALKVFTADALRGPWQPVRDSPVKVDARSARPAGALVRDGETLWRPAQDCSEGYGHGLTWCRIDAMTPELFSEHAVGSLRFAPNSTCLGPHTWNTTPAIELIDLFAAPSAVPRSAQPAKVAGRSQKTARDG